MAKKQQNGVEKLLRDLELRGGFGAVALHRGEPGVQVNPSILSEAQQERLVRATDRIGVYAITVRGRDYLKKATSRDAATS